MRIKTCDEVLNKLLEIGDSVGNPDDIDVYWKRTDKANLEYARKRGVSEYITFAGLGRVDNKRWPTGAREGSKNAERGAYTPRSLASLCKFLEREFKDCGDCLFVSGDGRALNDIVVENGKVVLVFGRATGCFTRESVENEETNMKKLNITKEQFNRSSYFRNKYGKLEYVSESGKLFKTNKGKVLMFKESIKDIAPGIQDWGTTVYIEELGAELDWKEVFGFVKADCRLYPLLEEDIGVKPYKEPSDRQIRNWIKTKPENFIDYLKEFGYYDYANGTDRDDLEYESTRRSARRFNERTAMTAKEAEKQLRAIGDNDPDSIIWILGDILRGVAENCDETLAYDIVNSVNEPKLAQLTMAIFQDIWDGRLNDGDYED